MCIDTYTHNRTYLIQVRRVAQREAEAPRLGARVIGVGVEEHAAHFTPPRRRLHFRLFGWLLERGVR